MGRRPGESADSLCWAPATVSVTSGPNGITYLVVFAASCSRR